MLWIGGARKSTNISTFVSAASSPRCVRVYVSLRFSKGSTLLTLYPLVVGSEFCNHWYGDCVPLSPVNALQATGAPPFVYGIGLKLGSEISEDLNSPNKWFHGMDDPDIVVKPNTLHVTTQVNL